MSVATASTPRLRLSAPDASTRVGQRRPRCASIAVTSAGVPDCMATVSSGPLPETASTLRSMVLQIAHQPAHTYGTKPLPPCALRHASGLGAAALTRGASSIGKAPRSTSRVNQAFTAANTAAASRRSKLSASAVDAATAN